MKSTGAAYILWFFFGWAGFHRLYTGNYITGFIWFMTFGLCGIGWFVDLFLTAGLVKRANLEYSMMFGGAAAAQNQNITVNVQAPEAKKED